MHGSSDNIHKKLTKLGPGGWKCHCCAPCLKDRPYYKRQAKRLAYRELDRIEDINNIEEAE